MHETLVFDDWSAAMHAALVHDHWSATMHLALVPHDCLTAMHAIFKLDIALLQSCVAFAL